MKLSYSNTFRAFRHRNYALYFAGQSVSQIGTWMQRTGVSWVIYTMTDSKFMLGATVFASQFPSFLFTLLGGIVSDRYNRYKVLLITQTASMIQAIIMAIMAFRGHYQVWQILSLSVVLGVINAFDVPARQPMVHEMVTNKDDLPGAIAFNSAMNNFARLVGPAMSGLVLQFFGAGVCFLLNAVSFLAVLASLLLMKLPPYKPPVMRKKAVSDLSEGFTYLVKSPSIGVIILMLTVVSLLVLPYNTLLPVFAKVVFHGNAATFGYINSFVGLGAVSGTFLLASLKPGTDLKFVLLVNTFILGIGLIFFSQISYYPVAMFFAVLAGFGTMSQTAICNTIVQIQADAAMRGRVISFFALAVFGMLPIGSLFIGWLSEHIGAQTSILLQGCTAVIVALAFSKFLSRERLNKRQQRLIPVVEQEVEARL